MRIRSVLETCVYARDLDAARRFYGKVLGLEPMTESAGRYVFFRCGSGMFLVFNPDVTSAPDAELPAHGAGGPVHVAFAVAAAELERWRERLQAHGVSIEREVEWPGGGRSLYVRDPAQNSVELTSPAIWGLGDVGG